MADMAACLKREVSGAAGLMEGERAHLAGPINLNIRMHSTPYFSIFSFTGRFAILSIAVRATILR